jgi:anti-anti-sigma factor
MKTTVETFADGVLVRIFGNAVGVDAVHLFNTLERFQQGGATTVIVDLADVEILDSIAIGGIVYVGHTLEKAGKKLILAKPDPKTRDLLNEMGVTEWLQVVEDYGPYLEGE